MMTPALLALNRPIDATPVEQSECSSDAVVLPGQGEAIVLNHPRQGLRDEVAPVREADEFSRSYPPLTGPFSHLQQSFSSPPGSAAVLLAAGCPLEEEQSLFCPRLHPNSVGLLLADGRTSPVPHQHTPRSCCQPPIPSWAEAGGDWGLPGSNLPTALL